LPIAFQVVAVITILAFASDIANLSRIVTLNNLTIAPRPDGALVLESTAKTFRYLDRPAQSRLQRTKKCGMKFLSLLRRRSVADRQDDTVNGC
jgi:type IV pilus assembly protein PilO